MRPFFSITEPKVKAASDEYSLLAIAIPNRDSFPRGPDAAPFLCSREFIESGSRSSESEIAPDNDPDGERLFMRCDRSSGSIAAAAATLDCTDEKVRVIISYLSPVTSIRMEAAT